ncbi:LPS export ABC transporter permease LptG [Calditrichota bacterium]
MQIIDRYIARRFFFFFFLATIAALAIYLVVDPIENLDKFLDKGVSKSDILKYYLLYIPYILYLVFPVAMLLATMFCIGGLTNSNELLAMTASGIPLHRHLLTLLFISLIMSAGAFYFGENIVPYTNKERLGIWRNQVKGKTDWRMLNQGQVYLQVGRGQVLHLDLYQPVTQVGYGIDLYTFKNNRITERISAKSFSWNGDEWILHETYLRSFENGEETVEFLDRYTPELKIVPEDLVELKVEPEEMGLKELRNFVDRMKVTGGRVERWLVDIHSKVALPFAGIIIVLFGVPVSSVRRRSGIIIGITISLIISFLFFGMIQVGKVLGYKELVSPWLAAWLGNIFFLILGFILYLRAPK